MERVNFIEKINTGLEKIFSQCENSKNIIEISKKQANGLKNLFQNFIFHVIKTQKLMENQNNKIANFTEKYQNLQKIIKKLHSENLELNKRLGDYENGSSELFKTVYDPVPESHIKLRQELQEQSEKINEQNFTLKNLSDAAKNSVISIKKEIANLYSKLEEHRKFLRDLNDQNKLLKSQLRDSAKKQNEISIKICCIENDSTKEKYKEIVRKIRDRKDSYTGSVIYIFTEEPVSNSELKYLRESLISADLKNIIQELCIDNSHCSDGTGISTIIEDNPSSLKRLIINRTLLDVTGTMKILEAIVKSKAKIDLLNLDENKLQGNDLVLLTKLFMSADIKKFSIKKNTISMHSIEMFAKATKHLENLEEIDVGDVIITEQKELEWRTDSITLNFNRVYK